MSGYRGFIVGMSLVVAMMVPAAAAAQLPGLDLPIVVGQKVRITSTDGKVTTGTVQVLTPASVEVGEGTARAILATADVRRIQVPDSTVNGVVKGALTLGLLGALWGAAGDGFGDVLSVAFTGEPDDSNLTLTGTLVGASVGALLGYALDAAKVKTIYKRAGGVSVGVSPIVSNTGKGVGVRVRW